MKKKRESGVVVVEAVIVVTVVLVFITAMLYLGMILYQQNAVQTMATQTATNIAQLYGNNGKDPFTGYVTSDSVYQSVSYSTSKTEEHIRLLEKKADVFARYRLKSSRILSSGSPKVSIDVVKKEGDFFTDQVIVTVEDSYDLPLAAFFGSNGLFKFKASARADCVDIVEYINGVEAVGDPENSNVTVLPGLDKCTVTFIPDRKNPTEGVKIVEVVRASSIAGSSKYTNCTMYTPKSSKYEFYRWTDDSGREFNASTIVNDNIVVYGNWKCTVTLDAASGTIYSKSKHEMTVPLDSTANLGVPVRTGYSFEGWFDSKGTQYYSNSSVITSNVTLTAKWLKLKYTVTFDPDGGILPEGYPSVKIYDMNASVNLFVCNKKGSTLDGWVDDLGNFYSNMSSLTVTRNMTLTAQWRSGCTHHRTGHCGVAHVVNFKYSPTSHAAYEGTTTRATCIVCADCGAYLNGYDEAIDISSWDFQANKVRAALNTTEYMNRYTWCLEHSTGFKDTYCANHSAGVYYVHQYE